jgi:hypothetical protein
LFQKELQQIDVNIFGGNKIPRSKPSQGITTIIPPNPDLQQFLNRIDSGTPSSATTATTTATTATTATTSSPVSSHVLQHLLSRVRDRQASMVQEKEQQQKFAELFAAGDNLAAKKKKTKSPAAPNNTNEAHETEHVAPVVDSSAWQRPSLTNSQFDDWCRTISQQFKSISGEFHPIAGFFCLLSAVCCLLSSFTISSSYLISSRLSRNSKPRNNDSEGDLWEFID